MDPNLPDELVNDLSKDMLEMQRLTRLSPRALCDAYFSDVPKDLVVGEMIRRICPGWLKEEN
jgi:hypothetical protein